MFLSCSLLSPDMVQSIGDKICQRCGYGLLVLDDCDMGDNTTSEMVTSIVSDVTGRYQVRAERIKCGDKFLHTFASNGHKRNNSNICLQTLVDIHACDWSMVTVPVLWFKIVHF